MTFFKGLGSGPIHALGMGVFDGMHQGHKAISKESDALLTFDPHPDLVLGKLKEVSRLSMPEELSFYVSRLITLEFTQAIANMPATEFLDDLIMPYIKPQKIIVGYDFQFGRYGKGNVSFLKEWAADTHVDIIEILPFCHEKVAIKSADIRVLMQTDFSHARRLLGHPYLIVGKVQEGDGRGRDLGFPTANIEVSKDKCIPALGVYKGACSIGGHEETIDSIIYIGNKPTFEGSSISIEAHLLKYKGHLYGQTLHLHLDQFIRGEKKFLSREALVSQINKDISTAFPAITYK